jgi:hypothetical protein
MKGKILVYPIKYQSRKDVIKIKPLMDLHKGANTCDLRAFKEFIKDRDELTYFFTLGDLWDAIYFDDKRFRLSGNDLKGTEDDDPIDEEVKEMAEILKPIQDRIICVGTGNHEDVVSKRCHTNLSKRLAALIDRPYLGYSFWFRLLLIRDRMSHAVDFFCAHGFGGGTKTEGGSITKYSRFADRFLCDVFCVGHDHLKQYVRYPMLGIAGAKDVHLYGRPKLVCLGGSWKKAYSDSAAVTWEETKGFPPTEIGGVTIEIKGTDSGVKLSVSM